MLTQRDVFYGSLVFFVVITLIALTFHYLERVQCLH